MNTAVEETLFTPWNPLDWLRIVWWFLATPGRLKTYQQGLDSINLERFRRTVAWLINLLYWLPLIILSIYTGAQPQLIANLLQGNDTVQWLGENWIIIPVLLFCCMIAGIILDPFVAESTGWATIVRQIVERAIRAGFVLAAGLGIMLINTSFHGFAILLNLDKSIRDGLIYGLLTGIPFGLASELAGTLRLGVMGAPALFVAYFLALIVASGTQGGTIFAIIWGFGFVLASRLMDLLSRRYMQA